MKLKQTRIITLILAFFTVTTMVASLLPTTVFAYKCTGVNSAGVSDYYSNGACYQAVGSKCLDNPPSSDGTCKQRDQTKDTVSTADTPVNNDGTAITTWSCSKGTYNATKRTCEICSNFGNCQPAGVTPTPKGNDATVDPNAPTSSSSSTSGTKGSSDVGTCAGVKTDYFACSGNGSDAVGSLLTQITLIVSVGVGIVAVGGVVYAGILYASAQDNQDQVRKSINVLRGVGIGILLYVLMVAIINFIVPGGVFSSGSPTTGCPTTSTDGSTASTTTPASTSSTTTPTDANAKDTCSSSTSADGTTPSSSASTTTPAK